jgi:hypothetical protein
MAGFLGDGEVAGALRMLTEAFHPRAEEHPQ